jgi:hypothetical protein
MFSRWLLDDNDGGGIIVFFFSSSFLFFLLGALASLVFLHSEDFASVECAVADDRRRC